MYMDVYFCQNEKIVTENVHFFYQKNEKLCREFFFRKFAPENVS
jgi:hypothetical protein